MQATDTDDVRYRLVSRHSNGEECELFRGRSEGACGFDRGVLIKRLPPDRARDPGMRRRLSREALLCGKLDHDAVVHAYDFYERTDGLYLALEYVDGASLAELIAQIQLDGLTLPVDGVVTIATQLMDALDYVHRARDPKKGTRLEVVHRDISPEHLLLDRSGVLKLIGFGRAQFKGEAQEALDRATSYTAPELFTRLRATPTADLFSAAAVLYELLTLEPLQPPPPGLLSHPPPCILDLTERLSRLPPDARALEPVLRRALAREPEDRFVSAGEAAAALRSLRRPSTSHTPPARMLRQAVDRLVALRPPSAALDSEATAPGFSLASSHEDAMSSILSFVLPGEPRAASKTRPALPRDAFFDADPDATRVLARSTGVPVPAAPAQEPAIRLGVPSRPPTRPASRGTLPKRVGPQDDTREALERSWDTPREGQQGLRSTAVSAPGPAPGPRDAAPVGKGSNTSQLRRVMFGDMALEPSFSAPPEVTASSAGPGQHAASRADRASAEPASGHTAAPPDEGTVLSPAARPPSTERQDASADATWLSATAFSPHSPSHDALHPGHADQTRELHATGYFQAELPTREPLESWSGSGPETQSQPGARSSLHAHHADPTVAGSVHARAGAAETLLSELRSRLAPQKQAAALDTLELDEGDESDEGPGDLNSTRILSASQLEQSGLRQVQQGFDRFPTSEEVRCLSQPQPGPASSASARSGNSGGFVLGRIGGSTGSMRPSVSPEARAGLERLGVEGARIDTTVTQDHELEELELLSDTGELALSARSAPSGLALLCISPGSGQKIPIPAEGLTLGRAHDNDLVLADPSVAPRHGAIVWEAGRWWLRALRGEQLKLNGERVHEVSLEAGQAIQIGRFTLAVLQDGPRPGDPTPLFCYPELLQELVTHFPDIGRREPLRAELGLRDLALDPHAPPRTFWSAALLRLRDLPDARPLVLMLEVLGRYLPPDSETHRALACLGAHPARVHLG